MAKLPIKTKYRTYDRYVTKNLQRSGGESSFMVTKKIPSCLQSLNEIQTSFIKPLFSLQLLCIYWQKNKLYVLIGHPVLQRPDYVWQLCIWLHTNIQILLNECYIQGLHSFARPDSTLSDVPSFHP